MSYWPDYEEFLDLAEAGKLVTICRELPDADSLTPVAAFYKIYADQDTFLFESVAGSEHESRYSCLGIDPFLRFESSGTETPVSRVTLGSPPDTSDWRGGVYCGGGSPFDALQSLLDVYRAVPARDLPRFCGGAVGYIGYDAVRYVEKLPHAPYDDRLLPDISFSFYDTVVVFDHERGSVMVTTHVRVPENFSRETRHDNGQGLRQLYESACGKIDVLMGRLAGAKHISLPEVPTQLALTRGFDRSNFESQTRSARTRFEDAVWKCKEYIVAGDIFQVVISQRFETATFASPISIYRALRAINPSPYMIYLRTADTCLVGSSPELMLRVEDGQVTVRPLAGTRPRGKTAEEDESIAAELLADEKERAEHVMLVDLGRNDVGRVSEYGSVELEQVMNIERYSHVMHISSTVTGRLKSGYTALDAMKACLPAGTVSGAPKVRAMQIIDELEQNRRGPYAGAIGFIDFHGNMETCLALRTMVINERDRPHADDPEKVFGNRTVHIQAGAGIVADSVPSHEYDETINKAKAILKAIEIAEEWRYPMTRSNKTVLSCIQPTAEMHIGNYFGAVKNWVELQEQHRCIYGIVDLHAMTRLYDPEELRTNSRRMFIDLLACGIDPKKSLLFVQSTIPEHSELCWILSCFCSYGELSRMTQFKEKSQNIEDEHKKDEFISAGLLLYPVLQAADILMYRGSYVPVGKDQEQHLELSRAVARRFNQRFNTDFFPEPQPLFTETPKIMSLADPTSKMSKSDKPGSFIGLFEEEKSIRKKLRSAVTDLGPEQRDTYETGISPAIENLFGILKACGRHDVADEFRKEYNAGSLKYGVLKDATADALVAVTSELRARRTDIQANQDAIDAQLREMTDEARTIARETLREVRRLAGLPVLS